jgi:hypothetical protein
VATRACWDPTEVDRLAGDAVPSAADDALQDPHGHSARAGAGVVVDDLPVVKGLADQCGVHATTVALSRPAVNDRGP